MTANTSKAHFKILVDGDACPVKAVIAKVAKEAKIQVIWISSIEHLGERLEGFQYIIVDNFPQATDLALIKNVATGDIVITQDYGLAALALGKGAKAISTRGMIYTEANIDRLLLQRHIDGKIRRGGGKTKGPKAMKAAEFHYFESNLQQLIYNNNLPRSFRE